jgi:hypothetical protein
MAVQHAIFLYNHMPNEQTSLSPHDIFTRSRWEQRKFHDLHIWGCPVYCLEKDMHDGKKLPWWKPRSHRTMNMGLSAKHASTVPLVLNLDTGYITSQFNIVFDDSFATDSASIESLPDLNSPEWVHMFGDSTFQFDFDENDEQDMVDLNGDLTEALDRSHHAVSRAMDRYRPDIPLVVPPPAAEPLTSTQHPPPVPVPVPVSVPVPVPVETVNNDLERSPRPPLLYPTRELNETPSAGEPGISPSGEPEPALLPVALRQQREIMYKDVLTPAPPILDPPGPRRSSRNLGQSAPSFTPEPPPGPRRSSRKNFGKPGPDRLIQNGYKCRLVSQKI